MVANIKPEVELPDHPNIALNFNATVNLMHYLWLYCVASRREAS
jgi:hypothetical protein